MLFNTLSFLIFLVVSYVLFLVIPNVTRPYFLLACSYFFYMCWNPKYALLLLGSTVITYVCGLLVGKFGKIAIAGSVILNLSVLVIFKYLNFFSDSFNKLAGIFKIDYSFRTFDIILPVGISFFVFQAIGYTIDVYRKEIEPEKNFFIYALFISFFPQLVAGPIERSKRMLSQIRSLDSKRIFNFERFERGIFFALYGFFMKMVIADRVALFVDTVFDVEKYGEYTGLVSLLGILLFTLQIYCDFAGYTYIAIGTAGLFGFDLCENFNAPYFARGIKDFWARWHMSLTTWFRDYLYIPLGGSRKGTARKYLNVFIVFLLSGLWHGAAWHFVVWGVIHGLGRIIEEILTPVGKKLVTSLEKAGVLKSEVYSFGLGHRIITFFYVAFAWTFFRASSISQALDIIKGTFAEFNPWVLTDGTLLSLGIDAGYWNILVISLAFIIFVDFNKNRKKDLVEGICRQNYLFKVLLVVFAVVFIALFGVYGPQYDAAQFIYFQF